MGGCCSSSNGRRRPDTEPPLPRLQLADVWVVRSAEREPSGAVTYVVRHNQTGDEYAGQFEQNRRHGRGIYTWPSGARFEGEWRNDDMRGQGRYSFPDGSSLDGRFAASRIHGTAVFRPPNGGHPQFPSNWETMVPPFAQPLPQPSDELREEQRAVVREERRRRQRDARTEARRQLRESQQENSHPHQAASDQVPQYVPGGGRVESIVRTTDGNVTYVVRYGATGDKYIGRFEGNYRNGRGTYTWASGAQYEGEWLNDDMHGQGRYSYADGRVYNGEHRFDAAHGRGRYTFADGSYVEGNFANDLVRGAAVFVTSDGRLRIEVDWDGVEPRLAPQLALEGQRPPQRRPAAVWACGRCTFENAAELQDCEMCGTARPAGDIAADEGGLDGLPEQFLRQETADPADVQGRLRRAGTFSRQATDPEVVARQFGLTREESLEFTAACVVCLSAPRTHALVPCGHMCLCGECLGLQSRMKWCPMCRADFTAGLCVILPSSSTACGSCGAAGGRTHAALPCGHLAVCEACAGGGRAVRCPVCDAGARSWHQIFMLPTRRGSA